MATPQRGRVGATAGDAIVGVGGLILLMSLFIDWYQGKATGEAEGEEEFEFLKFFDQNLWDASLIFAIALAVISAIAIGYMFLRVVDTALPPASGLILGALGAVALILVIIRLIAVPDLEFTVGDESSKLGEEDDTGVARELGGFVFGFLGAIAILLGGLMARRPSAAPRRQAGAPAGGPPPAGVFGGPAGGGGPISGPPPAAPAETPSPGGGPKADWYPDPHGQHRLRYWDGTQWTDQTAD